MNCRLFSQHENYTTKLVICQLILRHKIGLLFTFFYCPILAARSMLLKSTVLKKIPMPEHEFPFVPVSLSPDILSIFTYNIYTKFYGLFSGYFQPSMPFRH